MKPYIGIPCHTVHRAHSGHFYHGATQDNIYLVEQAGGIPVLLPILQNIQELLPVLGMLSGCLFPGGPDIQPSLYKEKPIMEGMEFYPQFDNFEMHLLWYVLTCDLPILGICRGMNLLNVAHGGTLYQDLPTQYGGNVQHRVEGNTVEETTATHTITLRHSSRLYTLTGHESVLMRSRHHQAVKTLGSGVAVSAWARDNVIEAIELPSYRFAVGIQGHIEEMPIEHPLRHGLTSAFIEACTQKEPVVA